MEFCVRDLLSAKTQILLESKSNSISEHMYCTTLIFGVVIVGQISNYITVNPTIVNDPDWGVNMVNKCGERALVDPYQTLSLIQAGL